jgi:hypothetical protein
VEHLVQVEPLELAVLQGPQEHLEHLEQQVLQALLVLLVRQEQQEQVELLVPQGLVVLVELQAPLGQAVHLEIKGINIKHVLQVHHSL